MSAHFIDLPPHPLPQDRRGPPPGMPQPWRRRNEVPLRRDPPPGRRPNITPHF